MAARGARLVLAVLATLLLAAGTGCDSGRGSASSVQTSPAPDASVAGPPATTGSTAATNPPATSANVWSSTIDPTAVPLGDGKVSTTPHVGYLDTCTTAFPGGGASHSGDWIDTAAGTWNMAAKVAVQGAVHWPAADHTETDSDNTRTLHTNGLPVEFTTGIFPIRSEDPAYRYDPNPNHIGTQDITFGLPLDPTEAAMPSCTRLGPIGLLDSGVLLYSAVDDAGRDAVAHETQDSCDGHPDGQDRYHDHSIPACLLDRATGRSTLVGYALDGYGIYVERDQAGNLPPNADLDACHGRTSQVTWNGQQRTIYHYVATLEYPYTIGCYHGRPTAARFGTR
ncbi:YHYH protein [Nakamurella multipartita]|uniref:YHYH domain-containing protein n=1 Tax=Nakamurella multipartita (strain ATCC 700099 / DSM 44233 / CIP 104796 / JCM 9543 / NBRC 105858 / Y-104) TaxID=479431 RepID=C8X7K5_NAKMY|nr:YHYH protein [Nakamurella multipartita]ACV78958.1 hypothetical protein Namu_2606 [Nakamurella multipartita DSM 44233]